MKTVTILGSTGSIGKNSLEIIANNPDKLKVKALAANSDIGTIVSQARKFKPEFVALASKKHQIELQQALTGTGIKTACGQDSIIEAASLENTNYVVAAITGAAGLKPVMAAIEKGRRICLANKESLVVAGKLVTDAAKKHNAQIIPVDSEHSAVFQCIEGQNGLKKIILTASGGPFRGYSKHQLSQVTVNEALKHPNWNMGSKITIDSATLMNKGLEIIEAHWLFNIDYSNIEVLVHPESIVHSLVEFSDGSVLAQLGWPDMKLPIQYAFSYPERWSPTMNRLDLLKASSLNFLEPDTNAFPCLNIALNAGKAGGIMPCIVNAANEVAVNAFLSNGINFCQLPEVIKKCADSFENESVISVEQLLKIDQQARNKTEQLIKDI